MKPREMAARGVTGDSPIPVLALATALVLELFVASYGGAAPYDGGTPEQRLYDVCTRLCTMRDGFGCCRERRGRQGDRPHRVFRCRGAASAGDPEGIRVCAPAGIHDKSAR